METNDLRQFTDYTLMQLWMRGDSDEALNELMRRALASKSLLPDTVKYDPDEPRDEQGRWTSGGFASDRPNINSSTEGQRKAIRLWQSQGYKEFNNAVRRGDIKPNSSDAETLANLKSMIEASPLQQNETLYRGMTGYWAEQIGSLQAGDTFTDKGFVASSKDSNVAWGFSRFGGDQSLRLTILADAGTHALNIDEFHNELTAPEGMTEREFIFAPNTSFEVVSPKQGNSMTVKVSK